MLRFLRIDRGSFRIQLKKYVSSSVIVCFDILRIFIELYFYLITIFISEYGDFLAKCSILISNHISDLLGEWYIPAYSTCSEHDSVNVRTTFCTMSWKNNITCHCLIPFHWMVIIRLWISTEECTFLEICVFTCYSLLSPCSCILGLCFDQYLEHYSIISIWWLLMMLSVICIFASSSKPTKVKYLTSANKIQQILKH